jgi:cyclopropane-fatty-acyl-phospholipid synthase
MKPSIAGQATSESRLQTPALPEARQWLDRVCRQALLARLADIQEAHLTIREGQQVHHLGDKQAELRASISIRDPEAWRSIALHGSVGAGESYMTHDWDCDDLPSLIRILARNKPVLDRVDNHWGARLGKYALRLWHHSQRNSEKGSRRNIAAHYDLGNAMFEQFLDPTMMYSSAIFPHPNSTLEQASLYKLERICQKLQLTADDHLIEIGTGWGAMALYAASHYGCRVTTTTISEEQYQRTREHVEAAGLQDRITLLKQDYRQLEGQFDKLVSIEMIEAVGHQYLGTYFQTIDRLLKPDGIAVIQAITIDDWRYEQAKSNVDFIKRYIFPGGFLPSITAIQQAMSHYTELKTVHLEDITPHYAETLRRWRKRFLSNSATIESLGYDRTFTRLWDFYFSYCEGGFDERVIGTAQMVFAKPRNQRPVLLGKLKGRRY